jgi:hypothetical protein
VLDFGNFRSDEGGGVGGSSRRRLAEIKGKRRGMEGGE